MLKKKEKSRLKAGKKSHWGWGKEQIVSQLLLTVAGLLTSVHFLRHPPQISLSSSFRDKVTSHHQSESLEEVERAWVLTFVLTPQITVLVLPKQALKMEIHPPNEGT